MEIINRDLGLEFYVVDYEYPIMWTTNPLGKRAGWLLMEFNYIDKLGQVSFQSAPILSSELAEIAEMFDKVSKGHILGYRSNFEYPDFNIEFKKNEDIITISVSIKGDDRVYSVSEELSQERLEEFSEELQEMAEEFPPRI